MVAAVILAAGRSSRLGVHKLLLPAGAGETVLSRVVSTALSAVDGLVAVVVGRDADLLRLAVEQILQHQRADVRKRVRLIDNPRYLDGLGTSVATGSRGVIAESPGPEGIMVLLADQPLVSPAQARLLTSSFQRRGEGVWAVAAASEGQRRNPVVFGPESLAELITLGGDEGARNILLAHAAHVETCELGRGLWSQDIDRWTDYLALAAASKWDRERCPLPVTLSAAALPSSLSREIEAASRRKDAPWLAPGTLFVALGRDIRASPGLLGRGRLAKLERSQTATWPGPPAIDTVILGNGASPRAYLDSLRGAALSTLQSSLQKKGEIPSGGRPQFFA